jgi:hypothetical protein
VPAGERCRGRYARSSSNREVRAAASRRQLTPTTIRTSPSSQFNLGKPTPARTPAPPPPVGARFRSNPATASTTAVNAFPADAEPPRRVCTRWSDCTIHTRGILACRLIRTAEPLRGDARET